MSNLLTYNIKSVLLTRTSHLRLVVFLALMKCIINVNAQGYTIEYPSYPDFPEGNCVKLGDNIHVTFNRDISEFEFNNVKLSDCNNHYSRFLWWGDGTKDKCASGNKIDLTIQNNGFDYKTPTSTIGSEKIIYYGKRTSSNNNYIIFEWTSNTYTYIGQVSINVCTLDPVLRSTSCYCPGSLLNIQIENFFGADPTDFQLSYDGGNSWVKVSTDNYNSDNGNAILSWNVPDGMTGTHNIKVKSSNGREASGVISMCEPEIIYIPGCLKDGDNFNYTIVNMCPTIIYGIDGKTKSGVTSWDVTSTFRPNNNSQTFTLTQNWNQIKSFSVPECQWTVSCEYNIPSKITIEDDLCYLTISNLESSITIGGSGGNSRTKKYQYCEYVDGIDCSFNDVLSTTKFHAGKTYKLRTLVYVNNQFMQYFDSNPFTIESNRTFDCSTIGGQAAGTINSLNISDALIDYESGCKAEVSFDKTKINVSSLCYPFIEWSIDGINYKSITTDENVNGNFEAGDYIIYWRISSGSTTKICTSSLHVAENPKLICSDYSILSDGSIEIPLPEVKCGTITNWNVTKPFRISGDKIVGDNLPLNQEINISITANENHSCISKLFLIKRVDPCDK